MVVTVSYWKFAARNVKARGGLVATENTFFSRWSQRKLTAESDQALDKAKSLNSEPVQAESITNQFSVETESGLVSGAVEQPHSAENEEPSVASLLVSGASQELKKAALRKLFLSGEFSEVCMLDDYNADYSNTATLTTQVAQTLRQWCNEVETTPEVKSEQAIPEKAMSDVPDQSMPDETTDSARLSDHNTLSSCDTAASDTLNSETKYTV
ncbi:TPA: DUF3306 domain-containing protein [Vibrio cholerae]|uniref:DUF3306 domain-containing protein n=1 Tax=Vibrio cholerae TaxID=666 RepID=UPI0009B1EE22|nr:DUF3306 domain-containing protein [Vibrio cholerae]MCO4751266.1 DUF3306 domain-containing protein [Vibrio cholerae O1 biovar El Tor]EGQ8410654.1 DUF3306 domain-containing protein [Vibrio cholerae]EGR1310381.1 DUF3306 domain-containing protein [Vibrio cholerae]EGR4071700.1 DUF3306 domain-containing protein [Vibrio cholerae]EHB5526796.1 DUF3306 domain-containing protein [Vibrio cholerae]